MMQRKLFLLSTLLLTFFLAPLFSIAASRVEVTFDFHKKLKKATNQYVVWVENSKGELVRTLFVTSFTTGNGWTKRPSSLATWRKFFTEQPTDGISGATPASSGKQTYTWDLKDAAGNPVPSGQYTVHIEANAAMETYVIGSCPVTVSGASVTTGAAQTKVTGAAPLEQEMISNFAVTAK